MLAGDLQLLYQHRSRNDYEGGTLHRISTKAIHRAGLASSEGSIRPRSLRRHAITCGSWIHDHCKVLKGSGVSRHEGASLHTDTTTGLTMRPSFEAVADQRATAQSGGISHGN